MSKRISLPNNTFAIVDDMDFQYLQRFSWHTYAGYAGRKVKTGLRKPRQHVILMHREIIERVMGYRLEIGKECDHIDRNRLNNRRSNLRMVTRQLGSRNRNRQSNNSSGYIGVSWNASRGKWRADIAVNGKQKFLGHFDTPKEAAKVRDVAAVQLHGEWANLNLEI